MKIVARDFNTFDNDIGEIVLYLSHNNKIGITILNLHDLGQAWMYVNYPSGIDIYDTFLKIMDKITNDLFDIMDIPPYKDIVSIEDVEIENKKYDCRWGNYVAFTRESVALLEEYDNGDEEENEKSYIVYGEILENGEFIYNKPICVISNKYNFEWNQDPVNFLRVDIVISIIEKLKDKYQIIYNRPEKIIKDDVEVLTFNDKDEIRKIKDVILIEDLLENFKYNINELQMMIFANTEKFISVQGGNSILSSYFGGENHIYAVRGGELQCNSFNNWYHEFSGCKIYVYNNYEKLIESI
jgi:hypothetical protein